MSVEVEARDGRQAHTYALKFSELLKSPLVKMAIEGEGVRLSGDDGHATVYMPQREF